MALLSTETLPMAMEPPPAVTENALAGGGLAVSIGPSNASEMLVPAERTSLTVLVVSGSGGQWHSLSGFAHSL